MLNKINKKAIIILVFTMFFVLAFTQVANAALIQNHTTADGKGLYQYKEKAVGNQLRIWRSGAHINASESELKNLFIQDRASSHVYCVQHNTTTIKKDYYDYTIKNYIKISGNVATNSNGQSITSKQNAILAYILEKEDWKKGYSGNGTDQVRNLAIKHYLTTGGWLANVGTKLGLSNDDVNYYNVNKDSRGNSIKNKVKELINNASKYTSTSPSISADKSTLEVETMRKFGPIKFKFTGKLESIKLYNGDTEVKGVTFKVGNKTKSISEIKSGDSVTIEKNNDTNVTRIEASASGEVLEAEMWLCVKSNAKQNLLVVNSSSKPSEVKKAIITIKDAKGNLTIEKTDKDTGKAIVAGFKIQTSAGKWLSGTNGSYSYDKKFEDAQIYKSSVTLKDLKFDTYKIYEVVAPDGYDLKDQAGYDKTNKWVYFGTAKISANSVNVSKKYTNQQKISIKGYVWIDTQAPKVGTYDSLYESTRESKVAGVTVNLVNKSTNKAVATTKTNANGEYVFDKLITKSQLKDYYVEFDYNGVKAKYKDNENKDIEEDISKYIPVAFNSTDVNKIVANGSRAIMDSVAYEDAKQSGIASTYKGTDNKETTYGLSGNLCTKLMEGAVLNNINLGIKKVRNANYSLDQNLEYVKIKIKGFEYTYRYGNRGDSSKVAAPKVSYGDKTDVRGYSAYIYPSDIMYKSEDTTKQLQVLVGYRIDITNINNTNIDELYKEKALKISSLTNKFDTKRYTLNDSNWKIEKDGVAKYTKIIEDIAPDKTSTQRIQFSVNRNAILDMLDKVKNPYGVIDEFPTEAITTGYHEYTRKDYSWENNISKEQTHRTKNEEKHSQAPYLVFRLGEERILKGKVFEDTAVDTRDGQKLGNGEYDNNENIVQGVKVELLDVSGDITDITKLNVSNIYPENKVSEFSLDTSKDIGIEAVTYTNENGIYTFNGIVPGYYFIRFTYGDGTQKICDINGKEISTLNAIDYKSTIVKNGAAKGALKGGTDTEWYKKMGSTNASVAIDNLSTRIGVNNGSSQLIMAGTAKLFITVENTDVNEAEMKVSDNGDTVKLASNVFDGLNLGVIKVPEYKAKLEKIITKMRLVNAQNNLVFEGNPEKDSLTGVSDLDDDNKNGGSSYVRAELKDEMILGSTLELTYAIKVTNISDVNYYNNNYYWFGEVEANKEVTLDLNEISDYLDNTLQFNQGASDQRFVVSTGDAATDQDLANKTLIKLSNLNTKLYTEKNTTRNNSDCTTSDSVTLVAQRILSNNDDDMEFINKAKISNMNRGTDSRDSSTEKDTEIQTIRPVVLNFEAQARATITPPTGADRQSIIIYTIAGALALAMLSLGVVVIKKFVVK